MKFNFLYEKEWQIRSYISVAIEISTSFKKNGNTSPLQILPKRAEGFVFFPDIEIFSNLDSKLAFKNFLKFLNNINLTPKYRTEIKNICEIVTNNLPEDFYVSEDDLDKELLAYTAVKKHIQKFAKDLYGENLGINSINIIPSKLGATRAYRISDKNGKVIINCVYELGNPHSMLDSVISGIVGFTLSAKNDIIKFDKNLITPESESVVKYLSNHTLLPIFGLSSNKGSLGSPEIYTDEYFENLKEAKKYFSNMKKSFSKR